MKPKDELQQDAGLVRDIEALCGIDFPADDTERNARDAFFRKAYVAVTSKTLEVQHVRRIHESLCGMKFPTPTALGLRRATIEYLARHHDLKSYRAVKIPLIDPPKQPATN